MVKIKNYNQFINEEKKFKNAEIGDYITQKGSDYTIYGLIVDEQVNGAFKAIIFNHYDGDRIKGKAKLKSTKDWHPEPKVIDKEDVPQKILDKIYKKLSSSKYNIN